MKNSKIKFLIVVFVALLLFIVSTKLHVEFLWFQQFGLKSVLITRIFFQSIIFMMSILTSLGYLYWLKSFKRIDLKSRHILKDNDLQGVNYTIALISSILIVNLTIILLGFICWVSIVKPLDTSYWWTYLSPIKTSLFIPIVSIFTTILLYLLRNGTIFVELIGCLFFVVSFTRSWTSWALAIYIPDSGLVEPLFNSDISFALGKYPSIILLLTNLSLLTMLTISISAWSYLTTKSRLSDWRVSLPNKKLANHLRLITGILLILFFLISWLSRHAFLWTQRGIVPGAGWLDIHFNIPLRTITSLSLLILVFQLIPLNYPRKKILSAFTFVFYTISVLAEILLTPFFQWIIVRPRELSLEKPYLEQSIKSTRQAFQLDSITTKLINPNSKLTKKDLLLGESTLKNIRLWDSEPLLDTNRQLQQLRKYYRFSNVAVDRYKLNPNSTERQQVMITARELNQEELQDSSNTWLNKHFVFTHGYGFTVSPINTKANDGLPEYFIRDLGISTKIQGSKILAITKEEVRSTFPIGRPAIYYGVLPSSYVIAPSKIQELDYPQGDQNIYNHYDGRGGVPLQTLWQRISLATYLKEPRILTTASLNSNSKILLRRELKHRLKIIAPFIEFVGDPYLVSTRVTDHELEYDQDQNQYWIVEGYTKAITYPYASRLPNGQPTRYIRNSVKAIVDAYNGTVKMYITEPNDPLIQAWERSFPNLFKPVSTMPIALREHLRVPIELFNIKVQQILRYHVTDSRTFYNGDDLWQVPMEIYGNKEVPVEPYHITAQLGDNQQSEFLLLQPLSPLARPNLAAWLAARNDGEKYGELVLLRFPSQTSIYGPEQIQALINQDPNISQQFSLWDRAGSEVIQGNLLVLPIGKALLYVEPIYLRASTGGLPTLTRVVVSDGKRIAMANNLSDGIRKLLEEFDID